MLVRCCFIRRKLRICLKKCSAYSVEKEKQIFKFAFRFNTLNL
jgi:hypothetical protein